MKEEFQVGSIENKVFPGVEFNSLSHFSKVEVKKWSTRFFVDNMENN